VSGPQQVVVVTGFSGSGKSTAIRVLEDLGYYCIDNLPMALIPRFLDLCERSVDGLRRIALGIDVREPSFVNEFPHVLEELRGRLKSVEVLFLEAADSILVRRFSETRRPHPLADGGGPAAGIERERLLLRSVRELADRVLDTSALTIHQLRNEIVRLYREPDAPDSLTLLLVSFGYKFGLPSDADMVFDARFLPNPHFVPELRPKTGLDREVAEFVLERPETEELLRRLEGFLRFTLPLHRREGRSYLTVGLGCTGGRHRSVAIVERLAASLADSGCRLRTLHRDIER
jgi:UPF0042 nucleotide-binding protein